MIKPIQAAEARKIYLETIRNGVPAEVLEYAFDQIKKAAKSGNDGIGVDHLVEAYGFGYQLDVVAILCSDYGYKKHGSMAAGAHWLEW